MKLNHDLEWLLLRLTHALGNKDTEDLRECLRLYLLRAHPADDRKSLSVAM